MESDLSALNISPKEEVPEVATLEPLVINKRGRSYLKNVSVDADNPALLIGWYDDRVDEFVHIIVKNISHLPKPPPFLKIGEELSSL